MANSKHLTILRSGADAWNTWRREHPEVQPDLSYADLRGIRLCGGERDADYYSSLMDSGDSWQSTVDNFRDGADLRGVILKGANLVDANLYYCDLSGADLSESIMSRALFGWCRFVETNFYWACLDESNAHHAQFIRCNLDRANFGGAILSSATLLNCSGNDTSLFNSDLSNTLFEETNLHVCDMTYAKLVRTRFNRSSLSEVKIYGVSVWDVQGEASQMSELVITPEDEPRITVDDLDIAQFLYLVLENKRLRRAIEGVTGKMVLILGRFSPSRKPTLDGLRSKLREMGFVSVLFDFDRPAGRDLTEIMSLLAHMSCFVLADITEPKSIPQELQRIIPTLPSVPVQPLIAAGDSAYSMFADFGGYPSVLTPYVYDSDATLMAELEARILPAVNARIAEIQRRRREFERTVGNISQRAV